jgi:thioesterase domain-containing protein/acyl carrier protein
MHIEWIYSSALCERSVAERQAESFVGTLRALIEHYVRSGVPAEATEIYPLAPQQQGMLLESLVGALPGVHVEQLTCRLEGPLDADRFRTAWASVIARHSVLRTCFLWRGRTRPLQVVYNSVEVPVETGVWESDNLDAYLDAERRRGFQLDRAPLMRLGLFRLTDHSHRFVWTQHHAILDGWCQPLVLGEVLRTYRDGDTEEDAPQYGHYLAYIKRQDLAACESFWRSQLEGFRNPTSPGRLCSESEKIAWPETYQTADVALDHGLTVELEDAARAGHVSLSTLVTGAWALLLARYSGSDDVLFGLTVAGRPADLSGAGKIVGLMANTLPLRIRIQDEAPIWSWIGEVGQAQAGIRMYETSPPDSVRRSSQVPAAMPLHDSVLVFENYPVEALSKNTAGLGFTIQDIGFHGARTQQTVAIIAVPGHQLSLRFVFDRRRIDPGSIPGDFRSVLEAIAHASQASAVADITNGLDAAQFPRVFPVARHRPVATETRDGRQATSVERRLTELWRGILDIPSLGLDDNFFDIGGHSLIAIDLLTRIRGEFGRDLPLSAIVEAPTVSALARLLEDDSAYRRGPLIALSGQGSRRPVCFLPGAGGNVLYFDALARLLHPDQPFFAIEARGLNGEDEILTDVEEIAAYNIEVLRRRFPRGPYLLGGHSFGCMVSLEMALQLQRQGQTVDRLFILDDMAPVAGRIAPDDLQEDIDAVWLYKILRLAERLQRRTMGLQITDLLPLSAEGQLDLAMSKLKEIDYLPGRTERASAHRYVQLFKANFRASFRYVARERFRGRLVLFRARDQQPHDPIVAYSRNFIDDPQWGWGSVCETVDVHWVPGDHISMMTEPNVRELAAQLARHLVS